MSYGFESFMHTSHNGQTLIGKGGDLDGYHSWLWLLPDQNVGALIVVNSDASTSIRAEYFTAFMDHFIRRSRFSRTTSRLIRATQEIRGHVQKFENTDYRHTGEGRPR